MTRSIIVLAVLGLAPLALPLLARPVAAQERALVIPQVEGERQGRVVGRAIACGAEQARVDALLRRNRERMLAAVGGPFTEDRYLPALRQALDFETSLPRPSEAACAKADAAFAAMERDG